jgi:hypothetical protein
VVSCVGPQDNSGSRFGKVASLSGRDAGILWRSTFQATRVIPLPLPDGDLDGDGVVDIIAVQDGSPPDSPSKPPRVAALSGATGRELWSVGDLGVFQFAAARDLNGDGRPVVLLGSSRPPPLRQDGTGQEMHLLALSGRDGKVLWRKSWSTPSAFPPNYRLEAVARLEGKAPLDVLVWTRGQPPEGRREWRAFRGSDGTPLWSRRFPDRLVGTDMDADWPVPHVGALGGDGLAEVLVIDEQVLALDGKDGQPQWTWQWPDRDRTQFGGGLGGPIYNVSLAPVLANLDGDGKPSVCFFVAGRLVVLDGQGRLRQQVSLPGHDMGGNWDGLRPSRLWACDLDGDGKDELVCVRGYQTNGEQPRRYRDTLPPGTFASVCALTDGGLRVLWEWPFPFGYGEVVDVLPAGGAGESTVVVRSGNRIYGLAGRTGIPRWRCEGSVWWVTRADDLPNYGTYHERGPVLLTGPRGDRPRVLFGGSECRLALPTDADGNYLRPAEWETAAPRPRPPELGPRDEDRTTALYTKLAHDFPNVPDYSHLLAVICTDRCTSLADAGKREEAATTLRRAEEAWQQLKKDFASRDTGLRKQVEQKPNDPAARNDLAWFLATCPDPTFRKPAEAVGLAKAAVDAKPQDGNLWNTLGVARYRAGDWQGALAALEKSAQLQGDGTGHDFFFLAMTCRKLRDKEKARTWYDRGVAWMREHAPEDEELRRFRAEAALSLADAEPGGGRP